MNEWKEVWYVWDGEYVKPDLVEATISRVGRMSRVDRRDDDEEFKNSFLWIDWPNMSAYTIGQKRRRLKCVCEDGMLYMPSVAGGYYEPHPCPRCNGTGFIKGEWEYQE